MQNLCTTLYLVRHGESEGNKAGVLQGQKDYPLTELGKTQAKTVASYFNNQEYPISVIYSSDLQRANDTAHIIADELSKPVVSEKRLRERKTGKFEGDTSPEISAELDEHRKIYAELPKEERYRYHFGEGAESDEELANRVIPVLQEIVNTHKGEHIMVVTHAAILRAVLAYMDYTIERGAISNGGFVHILFDGNDFQIVAIRSTESQQKNADVV